MSAPAPNAPTLAEAARVWARIALLSFGGPAGQIAVMHRILVDEKRWISERRFLHALNFCMFLPGPEAQQLTIYVGWLLNRVAGGVIAGVLFILPGAAAIMALSLVYVLYGDTGLVEGLFFGLKAAVLAIIAQAAARIGARTLSSVPARLAAAGAFTAIFVFAIPFPLIIAAAGLAGWLVHRSGSPAFAHKSGEIAGTDGAASVIGDGAPDHIRPDAHRSLKLAAVILTLWLGPVAAVTIFLGPDNVFTHIGVFFSQMAVLGFGGAYAVLAWVAQAASGSFGWLEAGEMIDGLAMAETTPGPLIMVTQFVAFMGAMREADGLNPLLAGALGGLLASWVTFTPCFLWVFLGAPHMERLHSAAGLTAALSAVTAAVAGVIASLALWFALNVVFSGFDLVSFGPFAFEFPQLPSFNPAAALLTLAALVAVFRFKSGVFPVLAGCAAAGIAFRLTGLA